MTRPVFAVDANVVIAMACKWHEHHERAMSEVERRLSQSQAMLVPSAALVEAYSVLTRLPAPHRLDPGEAWRILEAGFVTGVRAASLTPDENTDLLRALAKQSIAGGRTYDAIIAECARKGGASVFVTFNPRHFDPAPAGLSVIEP